MVIFEVVIFYNQSNNAYVFIGKEDMVLMHNHTKFHRLKLEITFNTSKIVLQALVVR